MNVTAPIGEAGTYQDQAPATMLITKALAAIPAKAVKEILLTIAHSLEQDARRFYSTLEGVEANLVGENMASNKARVAEKPYREELSA